MKNLVKFVFPVVAVMVGLTVFFYISTSQNTNSSFHVKHTEITAYVDDTFNVYTKCGISYYSVENNTPTFSSSNTEVLTIEEYTGKATCIAQGVAIITVELQTNTEPLVEDITVNVTEKIVYPTSIGISYPTVTLNGQNDSAINQLILDDTTLTPQVWSKNGFAEYDYITGKVTASQDDTVYIQIAKNETENFTISFEVLVQQAPTPQAKQVTIHLNTPQKISYELDATNTDNQSLPTPQVEDDTILQILTPFGVNYIIVEGLSLGSTTIQLSTGSQTLVIHVTVVE